MIDYAKLAIIGAILSVAFGSGWWMGYSRYVEYKKSVEIAAKIQEAHVESIKKQQEITTTSIQKEYDAKLALLRNYYAGGLRQPNSSGVSTNSGISPKPFDALAAYSILAGQCAETTQQLVSLQEWLNEQMSIK
jgi:hypothetical protein